MQHHPRYDLREKYPARKWFVRQLYVCERVPFGFDRGLQLDMRRRVPDQVPVRRRKQKKRRRVLVQLSDLTGMDLRQQQHRFQMHSPGLANHVPDKYPQIRPSQQHSSGTPNISGPLRGQHQLRPLNCQP